MAQAWTAIIEAKVVKRAGAKNLADFAANQFAGLHFADLVAYRSAPPGSDQLFDVASCRMIRDATHGCRAALGEGHVENARRLFGIVSEHFVKIPQSEKQESVRRQLTPDGVILLHHGRLRITGHGKSLSKTGKRKRKNEQPLRKFHAQPWRREGSPDSEDCLRNAARGLVASA
jgi:hypothetical protein